MIAVSACLVGVQCRYDGKKVDYPAIMALYEQGKLIPVCPEVLGGLPIPRPCCEMVQTSEGVKIMTQSGEDKTDAFTKGAEMTLAVCKALGIKKAILKSKSPSCGCGQVYDGTFSKTLIEGNGLTAELLMRAGIEVIGEQAL